MMVRSLTWISDKMLDANRERWSGVASSHAATRSVIRVENCLTLALVVILPDMAPPVETLPTSRAAVTSPPSASLPPRAKGGERKS